MTIHFLCVLASNWGQRACSFPFFQPTFTTELTFFPLATTEEKKVQKFQYSNNEPSLIIQQKTSPSGHVSCYNGEFPMQYKHLTFCTYLLQDCSTEKNVLIGVAHILQLIYSFKSSVRSVKENHGLTSINHISGVSLSIFQTPHSSLIKSQLTSFLLNITHCTTTTTSK